jgi:formylmethanofuran dehydrogenase subunit C
MYITIPNMTELEQSKTTDAFVWTDYEEMQAYLEESYKEGESIEDWLVFAIDSECGHKPIVNMSVDVSKVKEW